MFQKITLVRDLAAWADRGLLLAKAAGRNGGIQLGLSFPMGRKRTLGHPHFAIGLFEERQSRLDSRYWQGNYYVMRSKTSAPSTAGHFSDPTLLVLTSLAGGPKHGHAILNDIEAMCGSRLGPGTLYGAIARLEQSGLIERLPAVDRRQPYQLTLSGTSAFTAKIATLQRIVTVGTGRLATQ